MLAAILGFIGVKLILHALHENNLPFINGGEHVDVVEVPTFLSLGIIVGVLVVTVLGSLLSPAGKALTVLGNLKRHSLEYLDKDFVDDPVERAKLWAKIVENEDKLKDIERKYFGSEGDVWELEQLLRRVWDEQGRYEKATDYTR